MPSLRVYKRIRSNIFSKVRSLQSVVLWMKCSCGNPKRVGKLYCKCFLIGCCDNRLSLAGYTWEVKKGTPEKPKVVELVLTYE